MVLGVVGLAWVHRHVLPYPPPWDQAFYLYLGLRFAHALEDDGPFGLLAALVSQESFAAPLFPLTVAPWHVLLGEGRAVAHGVMAAYTGLLLYGTFRLARRLAGGGAGALAALLLAGFSMTITLSRDLQMDLPAAAWLPLAIDALLASHGFSRRRESVRFGFLCGLVLLTKTMTIVFLAAPVGLVLAGTARGQPRRHALLAAITAGLVAAPWWSPRLAAILGYLGHYGLGEGARAYDPVGETWLSPANLSFYAGEILHRGLSPIVAAPVALAAVARSARPLPPGGARRLGEWLLLAWIAGGYVLLTLVRNKAGDRYPIALLPPIAVLAAVWIVETEGPAVRRTLAVLAAGSALANLVVLTVPSDQVPSFLHSPGSAAREGGGVRPPETRWWRSPAPLPPREPWPLRATVAELEAWWFEARLVSLEADRVVPLLPPAPGGPAAEVSDMYRRLLRREPDAWAHAYATDLTRGGLDRVALARLVAASDEFRRRPARVLVVADHPFVNAATLRYYAERDRRRVTAVSAFHPPRRPDVSQYDAVVILIGGDPWWEVDSGWAREALEAEGSGFERLRYEPRGPDGSRLLLYVSPPPIG